MVLNAQHQLIGRHIVGREDDEGFDDFTPHRVGAGYHGGLGHRGMLDEGAFHLERPDAVSGGNDYIVGPAHKPVIAVFVLIRLVAGKIPVAHEGTLHTLVVAPVFLEESHWALRLDLHGNLAFLADWHLVPIIIHDAYREPGHWLAHGTGAHRHTAVVAHQQHRLGLAVPIVDGQARPVLPLLHHFGVQRLPGPGAVAQAAKVVLLQVFQHHHAEGRRRSAEGCDAVPLQHPQGHGCVEAAPGIVLHHRGSHCPLSEQLAVGRLGPASIRQGPVQVGGFQVVPVLGGQNVPDGAGCLGVQHHFGIAHGARGEIYEQRFAAAGRLDALQHCGSVGNYALVGQPAAPVFAGCQQMLQRRATPGGLFHLAGVFVVGDGHHRLGAVDAILDVAGRQQRCGGHGQRAQLEQPHHRHVPLRDAGQHDEHPVALLDAQFPQGIGEPVSERLQVPKGVMRGLLTAGVNRQQGQLGTVLGPLVHHVESEVEELRNYKPVVAVGVLVIGHVRGRIRHCFTSKAGPAKAWFSDCKPYFTTIRSTKCGGAYCSLSLEKGFGQGEPRST